MGLSYNRHPGHPGKLTWAAPAVSSAGLACLASVANVVAAFWEVGAAMVSHGAWSQGNSHNLQSWEDGKVRQPYSPAAYGLQPLAAQAAKGTAMSLQSGLLKVKPNRLPTRQACALP